MASGGIARASQRAKAQVKATKNNSTDKWIGKKFTVEPGDIVKFHTPNQHMFGGMGTVIGYIGKNTVLVRTMGGLDSDYPSQVIEVRNQRANDNYQNAGGGNNRFQAHYMNYLTGVAWRVKGPKPKKSRKPVKFYEVTPAVLPAVLSGEHLVPAGHKVVLVDTPTVVDLHPVTP